MMERLARSISEAFIADLRKEEGRPNIAEAMFAVAGAIENLAEKLGSKLDRLADTIEQGHGADSSGDGQTTTGEQG